MNVQETVLLVGLILVVKDPRIRGGPGLVDRTEPQRTRWEGSLSPKEHNRGRYYPVETRFMN